MKKWIAGIAMGLSATSSAWALDTVEPYGKGVGDVELYAGYEGVRRPASERKVAASSILGYGVLDALNAYAVLGVGADGRLANGEGALALGLVGTPLDTNHVDLDLGLEAGLSGVGLGDFALTPCLELNFDTHPERSGFGIFLTAATALTSRIYDTTRRDGTTHTHHEIAAQTALSLGASYVFLERHELLAAWTSLVNANVACQENPARTEPRWEPGKAAIGYNVKISDEMEWIAEFSYEWPKRSVRGAFGGLTGFIVTIPAPAPKPRE